MMWMLLRLLNRYAQRKGWDYISFCLMNTQEGRPYMDVTVKKDHRRIIYKHTFDGGETWHE